MARRPDPLRFKCKPRLPKQLLSILSFITISAQLFFKKVSKSLRVLFALLLSSRITGHDVNTFVSGSMELMNIIKSDISFAISLYVLNGESFEPI